MKAIRLVPTLNLVLEGKRQCYATHFTILDVFLLQVANKLYPISSIAQQIEDFAKEKLLCIISRDTTEGTDAEGLSSEPQEV